MLYRRRSGWFLHSASVGRAFDQCPHQSTGQFRCAAYRGFPDHATIEEQHGERSTRRAEVTPGLSAVLENRKTQPTVADEQLHTFVAGAAAVGAVATAAYLAGKEDSREPND